MTKKNISTGISHTGDRFIFIPVYPKDANSAELEATIVDSKGRTYTVATSVCEYIAELKNLAEVGNGDCVAALELVEAIETYIKYTENYFSSEAPLEDLNVETTLLNTVAAPTMIGTSSLNGGKYTSTSLVLEGEITLRHYFEITNEDEFNSSYTFYFNGEKLVPECKVSNSTTFYYYDIKGIYANNLDKRYTLEICDDTGAVVGEATGSILNYVKNAINGNSTKLVNLVKALYKFYLETEDYYEIANNSSQRKEILNAMTQAKNTTVLYEEVSAYNPDKAGYSNIKAITYDGLTFDGSKTKAFAYIGYPEGASLENPVPAVVLVHGGGGHAFAGWVKKWNDKGYAAIAMDTVGYFPSTTDGVPNVCYDESESSKFVYGMTDYFAEEGYVDIPDRSYATEYTEVDEQWAYHAISRIILAGNILRDDERVISDKVGITGISWVGTLVSQVIGYDNRFSFANPVYGTAYLGEEMRSFSKFADPYVNALWGAERNLDNATMPIFWFAWNDDNNFGVPSYVNSYKHTADFDNRNTLTMLDNWGHSHGHVIYNPHSYAYADWITFGESGFVTFSDQPKAQNVNSKLSIPEGVTVTGVKLLYITEPMSYKNGLIEQEWITDTASLIFDEEKSAVVGTVPDDAAGFYVNIMFTNGADSLETSSVYVTLK